jgi:multidrug resistance efflux pump
MMRLLAYPLGIFLAASLMAEDELPKDPGESLDIEPPLLIQEIPSQGPIQATPGLPPEKEVDPERIQIALEKAKKSAAAGERLYKSGVIAKVEAENRSLKVIRLATELAEAQLELAKQTVASQQSRFDAGEITQSEMESAKTTLVAAINAAQSAAARRDRAELDAALLNLSRQKKLLAVGSGRKSEVSRAEEKVAALQQQKN